MTPAMETRIYEAVSRLSTEVETLKERGDERHQENTKKFDSLFSKVDTIYTDLKMFPYDEIKLHAKQIKDLNTMVGRVSIGLLIAIVGGVVVGIFLSIF